jgi:phosphopentomutase
VPRVVYIVLDGVGAGALPDAAGYGDAGSDTLGNLSRVVDLELPFLQSMGLGNIIPVVGVPPVERPLALTGRLDLRSAGKDTTVGHWEHMGLVTRTPFPTYPAGFPLDLVAAFEAAIGRLILGNKTASGTAVIDELGEEHVATGRPIVYTSADSVFQIAAHVDVVPVDRLYEWCETARRLLTGAHAVARVIARPFSGLPGAFVRTRDRRDFSLEPPGRIYLDVLAEAGMPVLALGKISEVFVGRGISAKLKVGANHENLDAVRRLVAGEAIPRNPGEALRFDQGLLMTNLVDFDTAWGHRNDVDGFATGLRAVDAALPAIVDALLPDDLLLVTADHGVDPTTPSTDHSREYVPLLLYPPPAQSPAAVYEGTAADTGASIARHLGAVAPSGAGVTDAGTPIQALQPARGWRRFTPAVAPAVPGAPPLPCRVGPEEAAAAAAWLAANVGAPPDLAVILGSGLLPDVVEGGTVDIAYGDMPHWVTGAVPGHRYVLSVSSHDGRRVALLQGRPHEYEGFDLSEEQLPVRTLAAWGVGGLLLTSASGAVSDGLTPGQVLLTREVLDFQHPGAGGRPARLAATPIELLARLEHAATRRSESLFRTGVHASLPGPNYETPAELELLRALGIDTVSMSPAAELRAAHECGLQVAVAAVVANAGDTTHEEVLAGVARAAHSLTLLIRLLSSAWAGGRP